MAQNDILSLPSTATGLTYTSPNTAWGGGSYTIISSGLSTSIYLISCNWLIEDNAGSSSALEGLLTIRTGPAGSQVIKVEIPFSTRAQTNVAYLKQNAVNITLSEPLLIPKNTQIEFRIQMSDVSIVNTSIKLLYKEGISINTNASSFFNFFK